MKILLAELGNTASGDVALWAETVRRLDGMGATTTLMHRLASADPLVPCRLHERRLVSLPLPPLPGEVSCAAGLDGALARADRVAHAILHAEVASHDIVAIAPGGRFLGQYVYQQALASASAAILQRKPLLVLHQSVGPLPTGEPRAALLREVLQAAALTVIRDDRSLAFVRRRLGCRHAAFVRSRDPLLALGGTAAHPAVFDVGVNFRMDFNGWTAPEDGLAFLKDLEEAVGADKLLLYTTTHPLRADLVDRAVERGIRVMPAVLAPPDLHAVPGRCRVNVTDSFHGAVFSITSGRPAVLCQTDYGSWKLQGTFVRRGSPCRVHPGPTTPRRRRDLCFRVLAALARADAWLQRQGGDLDAMRSLVENGWRAVRDALGAA